MCLLQGPSLVLANLFALFRRFHQHVECSVSGLYTVKKIAENLGGNVES
jgi:hypothetical protein